MSNKNARAISTPVLFQMPWSKFNEAHLASNAELPVDNEHKSLAMLEIPLQVC